MKTKRLTNIYILILCSLGYFATDIYLPSLPPLAESLQASENAIQMTLFGYMFFFALTPMIFGPLSDHYGRKKILFWGLCIGLAATLGCCLSLGVNWLIFCRAIQGMGTGAVLVASRSTFADMYSGKELAKQLSYISISMPIIISIAPFLGGYIQENFGWQAVFLFLAGYITMILAVLPAFSETLKNPSHIGVKLILSNYYSVTKNKPFMLYVLCMMFPTIGLFGYLSTSPFIFQDIIGLSPMQYGSLAIYVGLSIILSGSLNAILLKKISLYSLMWVGAVAMVSAGALLVSIHFQNQLSTINVLIPMLLYFCCVSFSGANSAAKAMSQIKQNFGAANAIFATVQFLAGSLSCLIFSLLPDNSILPLAICFLSVGILYSLALYSAGKVEQAKNFDQISINAC